MNEILFKIVKDNALHSRWLNTLSFLEYIGARKIMKSQDAGLLDSDLLMHLHEETRHALLLKKLSLRVSPNLCQTYAAEFMISGQGAEDYFQSLDENCNLALRESGYSAAKLSQLTYAYVSWVIEIRAVRVYKTYEEILSMTHTGISLRSLLTDEEKHLIEMEEILKLHDPDFLKRGVEFRNFEEIQFSKFIHLVNQEIGLLN